MPHRWMWVASADTKSRGVTRLAHTQSVDLYHSDTTPSPSVGYLFFREENKLTLAICFDRLGRSLDIEDVDMKNILITAAIAAIAGCGSTGGVIPIGPDTFNVTASKHYTSGGAEAQSNALIAANAHCAALGKEILVKSTSSSYAEPFFNFSATFRCLSKNDPELARPNLRKTPDVLIEDTRK